MITVKEITELRKAGEIDKAYAESKSLFDSNPEDRYARISLSQSIKALMDRAAKTGDASALAILMMEYASLGLENIDEAELNNKVAWDVRTLLLNWKENNVYDPDTLERLFDSLRKINFVHPHRYYSVLLDAMIRFKDPEDNPWPGIVDFINWWGRENLLEEDYKKVRIHNGQMMPSLAERANTVYIKALVGALGRGEKTEEAEACLTELDILGQTHPEFQYTEYYKVLILKALGRMKEAADAARNFVKRRQHEFWAWSMLADLVEDDDLKLSCYCRALICKTDPSFYYKIRQKLAALMVERGELENAKKEYELIELTAKRKGWHIPPKVAEIMQQPWYGETDASESNFKYYFSHLGPAEEFLTGDVPETALIVVKFNPQKSTCSFITEDRKRGFFSTKKLHEQFVDNRIYKARLPEGVDAKGPTKVLSIRKVEDVTPYEGIFFRRVRAELNIRPGQTFTFIDDIYIDGSLLQGIEPGDMIDITAVVYYNIKRESWGWRALRVVKCD